MTTTLAPIPARTLRNADLPSLIALLQQQHAQKVDIVMPIQRMRFGSGYLQLTGHEPQIDENGVTDINGAYQLTQLADAQLGSTLDIPVKYVRKLRTECVSLLDTNYETLAAKQDPKRQVLVRMLTGSDPERPGTSGIIRAVLSDRYGIRDNLDTVMAMLEGMQAAGLDGRHIRNADLTDDRLYLRITAPEFGVQAEKLLKDYRSPFQGSGYGGEAAENPKLVYAGLLITNSETGGGAFTITPELRVKVCDNGMTINADALRKIHLGRKLDEGAVTWSAQTIDAANELVKQQMRDAVAAYMTTEYVAKTVAKLEETSDVELDNPQQTIEVVGKKLAYSGNEMSGILAHFIKGGQLTAGGIMHAVTSYAQEIEDVDRSNEFAATGVDAMLVAAGR
ncbi:hypothetical protein [Mycobacteroides abscessus]|uniref:hypothetical protein n=1 Tax=Mycobacteroides abscessus TaxID=36809 RepID=UPI0005E03FC8|nr:hypothetical protein [Mycobacteroides abscessus]CPR78943.1 Uncharacterised protein [Mycobacteroides abscessus]CPR88108.1 Uncharacterised protein [Mycobacteroides abscessus]CPS43105.1 Uncharacterised protein [Mycobacteroides abscessus]CPV02872.1 Uncharacterised protein [Mycobacteroides abscessus]